MEKVTIDYARHNEEVYRIQNAFSRGENERVLMDLATNPRIILMDPELNEDRTTFEQYMNDPATMVKIQLKYVEYRDTQMVYDHIMGPDNIRYDCYADFQNITEPAWFGCPVYYPAGGEPAARHFLEDEDKYKYIKRGPIDPLGGIIDRCLSYIEYFKKLEKEGYSYQGKPVHALNYVSGSGTDGPMTNACSIRGATAMCIDLYEDPDYAMELLNYITENTIARIKAIRKHLGQPEKSPSFGFADDSIALLSCEDYEKFVLPFHRRLIEELSTGEQPNSIHLCGDATRHFPAIVRELNVKAFDTGYPVRHGELVRKLGGDVMISGGVHVDILRSGTPEQVTSETRRILDEVLPCRNFRIKEANNLSPRTPPRNILAMYETVKQYGKYQRADS